MIPGKFRYSQYFNHWRMTVLKIKAMEASKKSPLVESLPATDSWFGKKELTPIEETAGAAEKTPIHTNRSALNSKRPTPDKNFNPANEKADIWIER